MTVPWHDYLDAVEEWTRLTEAVATGRVDEPPAPLELEPAGELTPAVVVRAHAALASLARLQHVGAKRRRQLSRTAAYERA